MNQAAPDTAGGEDTSSKTWGKANAVLLTWTPDFCLKHLNQIDSTANVPCVYLFLDEGFFDGDSMFVICTLMLRISEAPWHAGYDRIAHWKPMKHEGPSRGFYVRSVIFQFCGPDPLNIKTQTSFCLLGFFSNMDGAHQLIMVVYCVFFSPYFD